MDWIHSRMDTAAERYQGEKEVKLKRRKVAATITESEELLKKRRKVKTVAAVDDDDHQVWTELCRNS